MSNIKNHETRVQFAEENIVNEQNSEIQISMTNELIINIHLGFLQLNHKYEIKFSFESSEVIENKFDFTNSCTNDNHAQILEIKSIPIENNACDNNKEKSYINHITVHFFAFKEKFLKQTLSLLSLNQQSNKVLTFIFNARVLGKDKGTPSLKNGIQSIGYYPDSDEDD